MKKFLIGLSYYLGSFALLSGGLILLAILFPIVLITDLFGYVGDKFNKSKIDEL